MLRFTLIETMSSTFDETLRVEEELRGGNPDILGHDVLSFFRGGGYQGATHQIVDVS